MKDLEFPIFKTKSPTGSPVFDLNDPAERAKYFQFKASPEIAKLREYLKKNTFLAIMLGKKSSGKGTYSKLFKEALGVENVVHIAIGDVVRATHQELETAGGRRKIENYLEKNYRGYVSVKEGIEAIFGRSQEQITIPDEIMLALIKREIDKHQGKALFIDGFPRTLDQISYSLFFRDLVGYRDDPDVMVLIDIPNVVIDARMKTRVVCPICQAPRNTVLFPTKTIGYDMESKVFYLLCDDPNCKGARMVGKVGDDKGIESIIERVNNDEELIRRAFRLYGVPKILLRNSVPVETVKDMVDEYEVTPEYEYERDAKTGKIKIVEKPWVFEDENGKPSVSLLPAPVTVALIKQLAELL